ncbi:MAG TPA: twin-arginine translocation signal domain-containing protein, partial [Puia sp.]|nr:twin-arginine translocation signal domain-containing protein [Puia sp.]
MSTSRRDFLKTSAFSLAATGLLSEKLFASNAPQIILGIQLYSVRDAMSKDAAGTLKQIANIGYGYVEHANYSRDRKFYHYSAADFKKLLDDLGLKMLSGHTQLVKKHWDAA